MHRPILFFDARCTVCGMWRDWVELTLPEDALRYEDSNDEPRAAELGVRDTEQLRRRMCLLEDGVAHWGFDAAIRLLEMAPQTRGLARLLALPPLRAAGTRLYDALARARSCSGP